MPGGAVTLSPAKAAALKDIDSALGTAREAQKNGDFAAYGSAGARIERIAAAAQANKQAIYLYFGGKDKLFGAVVKATGMKGD